LRLAQDRDDAIPVLATIAERQKIRRSLLDMASSIFPYNVG
jgi:hypothetical protein